MMKKKFLIKTIIIFSILFIPLLSFSSESKNKKAELKLVIQPEKIYKESDKIVGFTTAVETESFLFFLIIVQLNEVKIDLQKANIEFYSNNSIVKEISLDKKYLDLFERKSDKIPKNIKVFYNHFSEPETLNINKLKYVLDLEDENNNKLKEEIEIPIEYYNQKINLIFPVKGISFIPQSHEFNQQHPTERSQWFAYDIYPCGENGEIAKNFGRENGDYKGWGKEVLAPGDGKVIKVVSNIEDNPAPGKSINISLVKDLNQIIGNHIIIDHGNNEFSLLAHFKKDSIRVKEGDIVKQGQVIGKVGNSGGSTAPHLHYQLMNGKEIFKCDGLPVKFNNISSMFLGEKIKFNKEVIKRGDFIFAE